MARKPTAKHAKTAKPDGDLKLAESGLLKIKAGGNPTLAERAAIKRVEASRARRHGNALLNQVPKRMRAKRAKAATRKPAHRRRRRISAKYRPYLERIAETYVETGRNATATARAVQTRLGLERFRTAYLAKWMRVPEFEAAVRVEEERRAVADTISPFVRGPRSLARLNEVYQCMWETFEEADKDEGKVPLLGALLKVAGEIRAEERHQAELKVKRAATSLGCFVRNLLRYGKETGAPASVWRFLERALGRTEQLMGGGTELVDADVLVRMLALRLGRTAGDEDGVAPADLATLSDEQLEALAGKGAG